MSDETLLAALNAHIRYVGGDYSAWRLTSDAAEAIAARMTALVAERDDLREAYADTRRLAREIDRAMHGDAAAQQASLCDLVAPAAQLRAERDAAHALLRSIRYWAGKHGDDTRARIDALLAGKEPTP